jgi:methyl-accepting chemotaxis protein
MMAVSVVLPVTANLQPPPGVQVGRSLDPRARSFFRRSTVQNRLTIAFIILGLLNLLGIALAIWQFGQLQERARADLSVGRLAGELHADVSANAVRAIALASAKDPGVPELLVRGFAESDQRIAQLYAELAQAVPTQAGKTLVADAAAKHKSSRDAYRAALRARVAAAGDPPRAPVALAAALEAEVKATRAVLAFHGGEGDGAAMLQEQGRLASRQLIYLFLLLTVISTPVVVVMLIHVIKPMYVAVRIARKVADGDLTVKVRTGGSDELARLMLSLDDMTRNLRRIVGEVVQGAGAVAATGAQVRQGQSDLSQRTETQASTLQQTASSMEELTATVAQNADTARRASELAAGAAEVALKGGNVVGQVVDSMSGISASARKIGEISSVIDGIAFQTNILALNAAVEAARAGDQGRGFAVVAAEVRMLAQRSATAAKEIKGLIGESVGKVESGAVLVDTAGRTMEEIVRSVRKVSDLIAEIAAASEEQKAGIEQVNSAIAQMDQVVQQNAAMVDQASQSTEDLHTQSAALLRCVAQFKLVETVDAPQAPAGRIAPGARA